nr:immunoglobulin heavy chain junction region [Macaca mulatta]MOY18225.1 immunoglobulin heavy chain junction region [Macaca mulatta]MOY18274.1 immunoglobulin heavy chain junction region [Macaca mulatta]MOY18398.1 immunoglobulin heavy chain junction region [Macaca mulatta]MOY18568.1 immunoglobulin heavy chain junction region [Macaca mulatta]
CAKRRYYDGAYVLSPDCW